jgi:hypothetical protein
MLQMQRDKLSGSPGCYSFTATVTRRDDKRVAIEEVALTRMLCEPKENTIETAFVAALRQTEFIARQRRNADLPVWRENPAPCMEETARISRQANAAPSRPRAGVEAQARAPAQGRP